MNESQLLSLEVSSRICVTLLHSVWQVTALVTAASLAGRFRRQSPEWAYGVHVTALLLGLTALPLTFALTWSPGGTAERWTLSNRQRLEVGGGEPIQSADPPEFSQQARQRAMSPSVLPVNAASVDPSGNTASEWGDWTVAWGLSAPWLAGAYAAGVGLMLLRLAVDTARAERLRSRSRPLTEGPLAESLRRLADAWSLRVVPALSITEQIVVPKVVGVLKPTILIPVSTLTGLSPDEVEMILAHELAHVRRYDMWVNLVQRLAETLLFFNPALWMLSRRISSLREYCCDELACRSTHCQGEDSHLRYAQALLRVVELGQSTLGSQSGLAALAASGRSPSELRRRVARLFGEPLHEPLQLSRGGMFTVAALLLLLSLCAPTLWTAKADTELTDAKTNELADAKANETIPPDDRPQEYTYPLSVSGRALNQRGEPISGARIFLAAGDPGYTRLAETTSNEQGYYRFDIVELPIRRSDTNRQSDSGEFEVFGVADGYGLAWRMRKSLDPTRTVVNDTLMSAPIQDRKCTYGREETIQLDITFGPPNRFRGRIVDHLGNPIAGSSVAIRACASARRQDGNEVFSSIGSLRCLNEQAVVPPEIKLRKTDQEGRFEFTGLPPDFRWRVEIRADGYPYRDVGFVTNDAGPEVSKSADGVIVYRGNAEIVLDEARETTFRVLYADTGEPADRVGVGGDGFLVTTDEHGLAKARLTAKKQSVSLTPRYGTPYLATTSQQFDLTADVGDEPLTCRINPAAIVELTVVDEDTGEPLNDVDVWWDEPMEGRGNDTSRDVRGYRSWEVETWLSRYESPRTNEEGKVRILFPPGEFQIGVGLAAYPEGYQSGETRGRMIACRAGETTMAVFQLQSTTQAVATTQAGDARSLRVTIVGPDDKPVGGVGVAVREFSAFDRSHLKVGEFVRKQPYGVLVKADAAGRLEIGLGMDVPQRLALDVQEPGYGPYWASWDSSDHPQEIPSEFTVKLERGWSVGGVVVDEGGQPVVGAKLRPSIEYRRRPGDTRQMGVGTQITTAADGSWRFDSVPDSNANVTVEITHPGHSHLIAPLSRGSYEVAPNEKPSKTIVMPQGLVVTGRVTNKIGQPIADATVRTKFHNDVRTATTDQEGVYRLVGCVPKMARIVVSAPGKALDLREVRVDAEMAPVDFVLQEGGTVRIKVVDENGVGIPKARIFFQRWRGHIQYFEFDHVNQYANDQGVWEWNEAPVDEFEADISRPGGMQLSDQKLTSRDEEYVFSPPPSVEISGKVMDAKTGAPIEKFRVVGGIRNDGSTTGVDWREYDSYETIDGSYRVTFNRVPVAALVRVEAVGYRVETSRDVKPIEGRVVHDFKLEPADMVSATIRTADGKPAAEAKIALGVAGSQINISNGDIKDGQTYAKRLSSDQHGRFELPRQDDPFQLVVTHDAGFAYVKSSDGPVPDQIALTPWARVEGVFRVGNAPAPGVVLELVGDAIQSHGSDVPSIFTHHNVRTGPEGQFVLERVFPGKGRIGRRIMVMHDEGATEVTSSLKVPAQFTAGQTTRLDLGGTGRPVVGRLLPPKGKDGQIHWNFAFLYIALHPPEPPTAPKEVADVAEKRAAWWKAWTETPDGQAWSEAYKVWQAASDAAPFLTASVGRDGSFRLDDTPPGDYKLEVSGDDRIPGTLQQRVKIPAGTAADGPVDLGELRLTTPDSR